ncbi:hypothetical protein B484DRAFT_429674 [Ochromonadaceae sp. CCMP2298]|nr:hypothetical protein B484DRAFT_429674 [Ochromonadaceae sp. CCMP2298]
MSFVCYIYLGWMYFALKSPLLKRHPTTLLIYKCIVDLFFLHQFLWLPFMENENFFDDDSTEAPYYCSSTSIAGLLAFLAQFGMVASELVFFVITYDMRMAYTTPFSSFSLNRNRYFVFVVGGSLATAFCLVVMGPNVYGMSTLGMVWIQNRREDGFNINYPKFVIYYVIVLVVYVYAIWAVFRYGADKKSGYPAALSNTMSIMLRARKFTLGFVGYLVSLFMFEFINYLVNNSDAAAGLPVAAYMLAFKGVWTFLMIAYTNWAELSWDLINPLKNPFSTRHHALKDDVAMEKLLLQPHLNTALRAEILHFTTQGIMFAARDNKRRFKAGLDASQATKSANAGTPDRPADAAQSLGNNSLATVRSSDDESAKYTFAPVTSSHLRPASGPVETTTNPMLSNADSSPFRRSHTAGVTGADYEEFSHPSILDRHSFQSLERTTRKQDEAVNLEIDAVWGEGREGRSSTVGVGAGAAGKGGAPRRKSRVSTTAYAIAMMKSSGIKIEDWGGGGEEGLVRESDLNLDDQSVGGNGQGALEMLSMGMPRPSAADIEFGMQGSESDETSEGTPRWQQIDSPSNASSVRHTSSPGPGLGTSGHDTPPKGRINRIMSESLESARSFFNPRQYKDFRFKDFRPKYFGKIRELCGIDDEEYAMSFQSTCKEKFSEGRSGAFMFFSSNEKCIVKTTTKSESLALRNIMPQYVDFITENPDSLVCRFLGSHCITMYDNELYFVVMLNVFPTFQLSERYDLKGSWVNRHGFEESRKTKKDRMHREPKNFCPLYQDNDMQQKISVSTEVTYALAGQIRRDVLFLRANNLMDYSLLIGVRREKFSLQDSEGLQRESHYSRLKSSGSLRGSQRFSEMSVMSEAVQGSEHLASSTPDYADVFHRDKDGGMRARAVEGPGTYYVGIIDILQEWNFAKQMERFLKVYFKGYEGDGLSAIEPMQYSERFWRGAVLDTFEGLEWSNEEIESWQGDKHE